MVKETVKVRVAVPLSPSVTDASLTEIAGLVSSFVIVPEPECPRLRRCWDSKGSAILFHSIRRRVARDRYADGFAGFPAAKVSVVVPMAV
jgi:hypothetical protein